MPTNKQTKKEIQKNVKRRAKYSLHSLRCDAMAISNENANGPKIRPFGTATNNGTKSQQSRIGIVRVINQQARESEKTFDCTEQKNDTHSALKVHQITGI
jgi:hypothetical protein